MKAHEIDLSLLNEQKRELVNVTWGLPEGSHTCEALTGVVNLLDVICDELQKRGTVQLERSNL